jgi:hypothetical protein
MKFAILLASLMSLPAFADGFVCENAQQNLKVKVYNQTNPALGTRNAAAMILSDTSVNGGRKTIAKFTSEDGLLKNNGPEYSAHVDLRFSNSDRKGENIGGTKLGELSDINLNVAFAYPDAIEDGIVIPGTLKLIRRSGDTITLSMDCTRYLKN